ncbi:MAG: hypothetical protein Q8S73_31565 [Deltaproteobacteria bacterium]|nr:hypothetical protein [Myxococcales bacterium]MDP3218685.1 hypothetical protein [Deltaproteobacteria bacterium]
MVRKVSFTVRPTPALGALLSFAQATRAHRSGLGERLDREVRLSLEAAARTLDPALGPMRWLSRRGLARASGYLDATGLAAESTVTVDLRSAVAAALAQGPRVDGRAYTDLYSLRALVRALRTSDLLSFDGVQLGRQTDTPRALLRAVEAACRETALCDEALVPKAFARATPGASPAPGPAPAPAPAPAASPRAERVARAPSPKARPTSTSTSSSFGGLPDDATSPPVAPAVELSARGLTLDAEFFLECGRVKVWPCSAKVLTRTRRAVLIALHPDRAGEGSEARFRSALKGFEDLARVLSTTPATPVVKPAPPAPPATAVAPVVPASGIGQWPPPPSAAPTLVVGPGPRRQSFKRSSKA